MKKIISGITGALATTAMFLTCGAASSSAHQQGGALNWEQAVTIREHINTRHAQAELAATERKYHGRFADTWADDNAWWIQALVAGYRATGNRAYLTEAQRLWSYDTSHSWSGKCGGAIRQHPGGPQDAIANGAYAVASIMLGHNASHISAWLAGHLQAKSGLIEEQVGPDCQAEGTAPALGAEAEAVVVFNATGRHADALRVEHYVSTHPTSLNLVSEDGIFNGLYHRVTGSQP